MDEAEQGASVHAQFSSEMNNENQTIRGIDVDLICEFFLNTRRQGPGSPEATLRALSFIDGLTDESRIADLGCGTAARP